MFPVDGTDYDPTMTATFDDLIIGHGMPWRVAELLPAIRTAGESAGTLTEDGARRLDPTGILQPGISLCPSEGDAGTGMVATNSVAPRTGNVSAGTSIFAMVVLEHPLSRVHHELDVVTTPAGDPVAMVHCNNGAGELNAWVSLFAEFAAAIDADIDTSTVFRRSYAPALRCTGLRRTARLQLPLRGTHHRTARRTPNVRALPRQRLQPRQLHANSPLRRPGNPESRNGRT